MIQEGGQSQVSRSDFWTGFGSIFETKSRSGFRVRVGIEFQDEGLDQDSRRGLGLGYRSELGLRMEVDIGL